MADHVRVRTSADIDVCVQVLIGMDRADRYPAEPPRDIAPWLSPAPLLAAWVAERDGEVAGHVALVAAPGAPCRALVARLFVSPAARRRGIGTRLLDAAVSEANGLGLGVELDVVGSRLAATALYERRGWRCVGGRSRSDVRRYRAAS